MTKADLISAPQDARTPDDAVVSEFVLEAFRLTSRVLNAADAMSQDLELSSARWQVISAIRDEVGGPRTVSEIARVLGLSRQGIQRIADSLVNAGFTEFRDNPRHRSANVLALTMKGLIALAELDRRRIAWSRTWTAGVETDLIATLTETMRGLRARVEALAEAPDPEGDEAGSPARKRRTRRASPPNP